MGLACHGPILRGLGTKRRIWVICLCLVICWLLYFLPTTASTNVRPPLSPAPKQSRHIPQQIWQIFFPPEAGDQHNQLRYVSEWVKFSPGFTYTLVGPEIGEAFVQDHFDAETFDVYRRLHNPALKSDLLRYMLLWTEGGYYSDLDTKPVKPLKDWLPMKDWDKIRLIIAPEHDDGVNSAGKWPHPVQFCQWTIAAAPGHTVLERMIQRAVTGLKDLASAQGVEIDQLQPSNNQIWNATGPPAWTEIVFDVIKGIAPEIRTYHGLSRLAEPRVFGDILLLPMDAFMTLSEEMRVLKGAGQHQLVHHDFSGAWKTT